MLRSSKKTKGKQPITESRTADDINILNALEKVNKVSWQVIDTYFKDNPNNLVGHHLDSYNHFIKHGIPSIFSQHNSGFEKRVFKQTKQKHLYHLSRRPNRKTNIFWKTGSL